jgi:nitroreductase
MFVGFIRTVYKASASVSNPESKEGDVMKVVDRQQILETLSWRYATKKFDSAKKISDSDWKVLSESLRLAPSSYGLQPWKFILVENKQVRRELTPLSWNQTQVEDCSHYVVFAARTAIDEAYADKWMKCLADTREIPVEKLAAYRELMFKDIVKGPRSKIADTWSQRQSYIAMGFLMETAALLGIDTCAMEGIDPPVCRRLGALRHEHVLKARSPPKHPHREDHRRPYTHHHQTYHRREGQ